ncbi:MAG TPA: DNA polymerase III subunit beta [Candidatus Absconditabacterales bacterium]|nr:DNA polymerase III subunit beta [Candidatus Absconditabacterales bacterium]
MKITINTAKLNDIVDISSRFVAKNATLPILQNIYLKASIDNLIVRATDMEKYIEIETPCDIKLEGAITINAKMFSDIIKTIEDEQIEISTDPQTNTMIIKTRKDNFEINGISANEYVALPDVPQENTITLDTQSLSDGIEKVEYSVTEKNFSPVLTGVLMKSKEENGSKKLVFVGTDSFRLTEYKTNSSIQGDDFSLIIPKMSIIDIKKISDFAKEKESENVIVKYSNNLVAFEFEINDMKILATSLLIQGNFPDYEKEEIMPTNFNTKLIINKDDCEKAIKKIGILTRDINNYIELAIDNGEAIVSSGKTDKGMGKTNIPILMEGESVSFGVNGRYITDFIRTMESDEIVFNIVDNQRPIILQNKNNTNYNCVIRPLLNG